MSLQKPKLMDVGRGGRDHGVMVEGPGGGIYITAL